MSSFTGNQKATTPSPSSFSSYQFDFGFGSSTRNSNAPAPLKDQKPNSTAAATPSWTPQQPSKPAWTHQPAPRPAALGSLSGPTSMVGDISGRSWNATAPTGASATSFIGIAKSNPNLFGDLVGSALGQGKNSDTPLKANNSYSMGNLADSLPKSGNNVGGGGGGNSMKSNWGSADNFGNFGGSVGSSANSMNSSWGSAEKFGSFSSLNQPSKPLGGQPMKSSTGIGSNAKEDPFGSLMNFGPKNSSKTPINVANVKSSGAGSGGAGSSFGAFQSSGAGGSTGSSFAAFQSSGAGGGIDSSFGAFQSSGAGSRSDSSFGAFQNSKAADFGMPAQKPGKTGDFSFGESKNAQMNDFGIPPQPQATQQAAAVDPLDSLFPSSGNSSGVSGSQQFGEMNDWDVGAEFGGQDHSETTTELEGLPPPPAGVTSSMAKTKGMDNYKQGQFADAIKWLSWAVVLIEKNGESAEADEVLTCRASCYKEVGEYKKAVADCSKV